MALLYPAQGCGISKWINCGKVVIGCAKKCDHFQADSCISCVSNSYNTCKDCFSLVQEIEMQGTNLIIVHGLKYRQLMFLAESSYMCTL